MQNSNIDPKDIFIDVAFADYKIGAAPQILRSNGIGSCIVVCLYNKLTKTGALAHAMLPKRHSTNQNPLRYIDSVIPLVLEDLAKINISKTHLTAKIFGGATMFPILWSGEKAIGNKNIFMVKNTLKTYGIKIVQEDIGGTSGRSLEFELETGNIHLISKGKPTP